MKFLPVCDLEHTLASQYEILELGLITRQNTYSAVHKILLSMEDVDDVVG